MAPDLARALMLHAQAYANGEVVLDEKNPSVTKLNNSKLVGIGRVKAKKCNQ